MVGGMTFPVPVQGFTQQYLHSISSGEIGDPIALAVKLSACGLAPLLRDAGDAKVLLEGAARMGRDALHHTAFEIVGNPSQSTAARVFAGEYVSPSARLSLLNEALVDVHPDPVDDEKAYEWLTHAALDEQMPANMALALRLRPRVVASFERAAEGAMVDTPEWLNRIAEALSGTAGLHGQYLSALSYRHARTTLMGGDRRLMVRIAVNPFHPRQTQACALLGMAEPPVLVARSAEILKWACGASEMELLVGKIDLCGVDLVGLNTLATWPGYRQLLASVNGEWWRKLVGVTGTRSTLDMLSRSAAGSLPGLRDPQAPVGVPLSPGDAGPCFSVAERLLAGALQQEPGAAMRRCPPSLIGSAIATLCQITGRDRSQVVAAFARGMKR